MARRFNAPPGWPTPPDGWIPPEGWRPDPSWPPAPAGWQFWIDEPSPAGAAPGMAGGEPWAGGAPQGPAAWPQGPAGWSPGAGTAPPPYPYPADAQSQAYAARLAIDYPQTLDRVTTAFRLIWVIPIAVVLSLLSASGTSTYTVATETGEVVSRVTSSGGGIAGGLFSATLLMILFRQRYPKWWFDFALELNRFGTRVGSYLLLLTDRYPSTVEAQSVHLEIDYPDVQRDLNRWLPLVKWILVIPHVIVLAFLAIGAGFAVIAAWFAILFTGRYPRGLFDYVVGVFRWGLRVEAYAGLLVTDRYPPFSLQ